MSILCSMVGASFTVAAAAVVIRRKLDITAVGNAQVDTAQSKFGGASPYLMAQVIISLSNQIRYQPVAVLQLSFGLDHQHFQELNLYGAIEILEEQTEECFILVVLD